METTWSGAAPPADVWAEWACILAEWPRAWRRSPGGPGYAGPAKTRWGAHFLSWQPDREAGDPLAADFDSRLATLEFQREFC